MKIVLRNVLQQNSNTTNMNIANLQLKQILIYISSNFL